jgi:nucleotide-binding universal stress UspA family protein
MDIRQIVAAADDSEEGRTAIRVAASLGRRSGAQVTVLTVVEVPTADDGPQPVDHLRAVVAHEIGRSAESGKVSVAATVGLAGIEITRFAENQQADLIVLGRKERSTTQRLLLGDTADAVARRSGLPCLFVRGGQSELKTICAALDGTDRGLAVLQGAMDFARAIGGSLRAITVEPAHDGRRHDVPMARTLRLREAVERARRSDALQPGSWGNGATGADHRETLAVRQGGIVDEILRDLESRPADVLVLGYHRGGPAGVIDAGSVARRLAHQAPCAVLTLPF